VKTFLKIVAGVVLALVVIGGAGMMYMTRGLKETQNLAIKNVDVSKLADGVYVGEFTGSRWANTVEVTVKNRQIVSATVAKDQRFAMSNVSAALISRVLQKQTPNVDVVTGATVSSKGYLKAIENALAGQKTK